MSLSDPTSVGVYHPQLGLLSRYGLNLDDRLAKSARAERIYRAWTVAPEGTTYGQLAEEFEVTRHVVVGAVKAGVKKARARERLTS